MFIHTPWRIVGVAVMLAWAWPQAGSTQEPPAALVQEKPEAVASASLLGQPPEVYRERRLELMKRLKAGRAGDAERGGTGRSIVVVRGADDPDIEARFRQANDLAYLTGVSVPFATLVLWPEQGEEALYLPRPGRLAGVFVEAQRGPGEETARALGLSRVEDSSRLLGDLFTDIADPLTPTQPGGSVVYLPDAGESGVPRGPQGRLTRILKEGAPGTRFVDLRPHLSAMRRIKSASELALVERAILVTGEALDRAAATIRPGLHEYTLRGVIEGAFVERGAQRPGFPSIVASGPNATIPHYFSTDRQIEAGDLVVLDIGAECELYTADITRTLPASGKFTDRQRAIYQLVLDAQRAVEREMKPGKHRLPEMTRFVSQFFDRSELRVVDENGNEQRMGRYFIHGLGHGLGMDVHDVGGTTEPVEVGEVFTIEPGLYIPSEGIGVRIEDDYVMTEEGPRKLSNAIPSDPDEVERWLAHRGKREPTQEKGEVGP